jgi:hypothetical protein
MAKYSMKMGGKEVGSASVYAPPHTMTGSATRVQANPGSLPDSSEANNVNMSVGNISRNPNAGATKTSGIKIRGTGAATKGTMARGPMA